MVATTKRHKIVFLDIDGVLNTLGVSIILFRHIVPELANRLSDWALKNRDVEFVMSSAWRTRYKDLGELRDDMWKRGVMIPTLRWTGMTPRFPGRHRGEEIQFYLDQTPSVQSIAILDDSSDMCHLGPYLVRTKGSVGITQYNLSQLENMLQIPYVRTPWQYRKDKSCNS